MQLGFKVHASFAPAYVTIHKSHLLLMLQAAMNVSPCEISSKKQSTCMDSPLSLSPLNLHCFLSSHISKTSVSVCSQLSSLDCVCKLAAERKNEYILMIYRPLLHPPSFTLDSPLSITHHPLFSLLRGRRSTVDGRSSILHSPSSPSILDGRSFHQNPRGQQAVSCIISSQ